jgi:Cu(I)/Ag(I) efflux system periplasmic protein CusF
MRPSRNLLIAIAATTSLAGHALAADKMAEMPGMNMSKTSTPAATTTHTATGVVKAADVAGGKVTISHEAIKTLGWSGMTMGFTVKDKALFSKLKIGAQVDFQLVKEGNEYVVVAVK